MKTALKLKELRWATTVYNSFIGSVVEAANAVAAGACRRVLVWRAMHNPPGNFGRYIQPSAGGDDQFMAPYGLADFVSAFALPYSRYMALYGATREHMATFSVNNRLNAAANPDAIFYEKPISVTDYLRAPMIVEPLSLLDCDMPVDGCGAVIVTRADGGSDASPQYDPVDVCGHASIVPEYGYWFNNTLENLQRTTAELAKVLWKSCRLGPADIRVANLYDGFSFFTYLYLEALGFCGPGEAYEFIQGGRIALNGELPLNTSGGSLGMGRLHGPPQVIESVRQIQGRCGTRQVKDVDVALATTGSPRFGPGAIVLAKRGIAC
jgi:acetyl-CoA acetyltransferase